MRGLVSGVQCLETSPNIRDAVGQDKTGRDERRAHVNEREPGTGLDRASDSAPGGPPAAPRARPLRRRYRVAWAPARELPAQRPRTCTDHTDRGCKSARRAWGPRSADL